MVKRHLIRYFKPLLIIAILTMMFPSAVLAADEELSIDLGSVSISGDTYYYANADIIGDGIKTILINFSDSVTEGDEIVLPASTPSGFTVSASSAGNDYTKRINIDSGVSASAVQSYMRGVGFKIASENQTVSVTVTSESITVDTFYNIDTQHYYQFIPSTTTNWIDAYNAAKNMTFMGRTGYLATVMSKEEDIYLNSLSGGKTGWLGGTLLTNTGSSGGLYYDGFNTNSVVTTGWYWACGPEKGTTFFNVNSLYPSATSANAAAVDAANTATYYNWARGNVSFEPNNQTAYLYYTNLDYEACLTTLVISGNSGKSGTSFSWNDKHYTCAGLGDWDAKGYFVEYGNLPLGDNSVVSTAFATDSAVLHKPSGDVCLTTVTWTGATSYTCGMDLPDASKMVTVSVDSGYFTVPSLGGALTFLGGTSGTTYISAYASGTHYDSAVFSYTDASAAETLLSGIVYALDGLSPQIITATSSTISPENGDIYFEGHFYRYVDSGASSIDWPTAVLNAGATDDPYFGGRGYIVTATTQAENSILLRLVENGAAGSDHWDDAWIGGLWQRNTGTLASPVIVRGIDGYELTYDDLDNTGNMTELLKDYSLSFNDFNANDSSTFIYANSDTVTYYWIDGPEAGQEIANNTADFAPWHVNGSGQQDEPNAGDFAYIGWQGAYWDDLSTGDSGSGFDKLDGYIIEFSGFDGGSSAGIIKQASKTVSAYTAAVETYLDGSPSAVAGTVQLRQNAGTAATAASTAAGVYTAVVHDGVYDIYIDNEDTGTDLVINGTANSAAVNYYTVSFSITETGTASGSTVSAAADGSDILSGAAVLAGKPVVITASGAGAVSYAYAWSGSGTGGETTAALSIVSLSGTIDAQCDVAGTTPVTVMFDAEDGSVSPLTQIKRLTSTYGKAQDGTTDEALPIPVRTGYTFSGWWTGDNGTGSIVTDAAVLSTASDHILYAKWTAKTYTVTFNTNGGAAVSAVTRVYGAAMDFVPETFRTGYVFAGWYSDSGLKNAYDFNSAVTEDITLYAKWTQVVLTAQAAMQNLKPETAFSFAWGDTWECITENFVMLGSFDSGARIIWTSSDVDVVRIELTESGAAGIVMRPQNNDASVVITAATTINGESVSKSFLLIVKYQGVSKDAVREVTARTADICVGESMGTETIYRTVLNNGVIIDYVNVTADAVQALVGQGGASKHLSITVGSDADVPADEFDFEVSSDTVSALAQNGLGITLKSPFATVSLSADTLAQAAQSGTSLYYRIVQVEEEAQEAAEAFKNDRTVFSLSDGTGSVFGTPKTIQTNMEGVSTTVILPLEDLSDAQLSDEEFLKTLCIYVEHDDGTTELISGSLVYTDDLPTGIQFEIAGFSRFQVVSIQAETSYMWVWFIAAGALMTAAAVLRWRKRKRGLKM